MEAVDAVSKVLDDDNLLIEILLCVDLPTTLVCAALVCKRWLQHASNREFLGRFRKLHPPRLIGFYIQERLVPTSPRFVLMLPAQHRERAAVVRRAKFSLETNQSSNVWPHIMDCRNGRVLTQHGDGNTGGLQVHIPLCHERHEEHPTTPNPRTALRLSLRFQSNPLQRRSQQLVLLPRVHSVCVLWKVKGESLYAEKWCVVYAYLGRSTSSSSTYENKLCARRQ